MLSLTPGNKGVNTNISVEYGDISCWLVFCSSPYSEEKFRTFKITAWYPGDTTKNSSFIKILSCYSKRNNRKPVLVDIIA